MSEMHGVLGQDTNYYVTNRPPDNATAKDVDATLLGSFRRALDDQSACAYEHQADAFCQVLNDGEVALVAGTAAGKTYAAALPLLHKLFVSRRIRKALFLYPTRALLEDQR